MDDILSNYVTFVQSGGQDTVAICSSLPSAPAKIFIHDLKSVRILQSDLLIIYNSQA